MNFGIACLEKEKEKLTKEIAAGKREKIVQKREFENCIYWLRKIFSLQLDEVKNYELIKLPDMQTGFSEFHIVNDCESANPGEWVALKDEDGQNLVLQTGDILVRRK